MTTIPPEAIRRYVSLVRLAEHPATPVNEAQSARTLLATMESKHPGIRVQAVRAMASEDPVEDPTPPPSRGPTWASVVEAVKQTLDGAALGQAVQRIVDATVQITIVKQDTGGMYIGIDVAPEAFVAADRISAREVLHTTIAGLLIRRLNQR